MAKEPTRQRSGVKIQLDASAVAYLLGGNNEVEVELRNAVVQEFAQRHLKAVANEYGFKKIEQALMDEINGMLYDNPTSWARKYKKDVIDRLRDAARSVVDEAVAEQFNTLDMDMRKRVGELELLVRSDVDKAIASAQARITEKLQQMQQCIREVAETIDDPEVKKKLRVALL